MASLTALSMQGAFARTSAEPLGSLMSLPKRQKATKASGRLDENEVVLISDMHVLAGSHTPDRLTRVVDEVLAMRPLPANVIGLGDLANLYGHVEDYECARRLLQPLEDAGIQVTLAADPALKIAVANTDSDADIVTRFRTAMRTLKTASS